MSESKKPQNKTKEERSRLAGQKATSKTTKEVPKVEQPGTSTSGHKKAIRVNAAEDVDNMTDDQVREASFRHIEDQSAKAGEARPRLPESQKDGNQRQLHKACTAGQGRAKTVPSRGQTQTREETRTKTSKVGR